MYGTIEHLIKLAPEEAWKPILSGITCNVTIQTFHDLSVGSGVDISKIPRFPFNDIAYVEPEVACA